MALPAQHSSGAEYLVRGTPEECLNSATSYLSDRSYEIDVRTETQVTMSRPSLTPGWGFFFLIMGLFTFGAALLGILAMYWIKRRVTVVALPSNDDLSQVTVSWSNDEARKVVEGWVREELGTRARPAGPRLV
jgi:hypothetical protein